jgi:hypothetical protein
MMYWWVNHRADELQQERASNLIFAPLKNAGECDPMHWRHIDSVGAGDVLLAFSAEGLHAILTASAAAARQGYPQDWTPSRIPGQPHPAGRGVAVQWRDVWPPIAQATLLEGIDQSRLIGRGLPLNHAGGGKQGYVWTLPRDIGTQIHTRALAARP